MATWDASVCDRLTARRTRSCSNAGPRAATVVIQCSNDPVFKQRQRQGDERQRTSNGIEANLPR
jgi:hypothetical protein